MPTVWDLNFWLCHVSQCFEQSPQRFYYLTYVWNTSQQNWVTPCRNEQNTGRCRFRCVVVPLLAFHNVFPTILPLNADAVKRESNKWTEERNWPNKRDLDFVCCWDKAALSSWLLLLKLGWTPPLLLKVVKIKLRSSSICSHSLWGSLFMPDWGYYQAMDTIILRVFILLPHCWKFACFKYESEKDIK